MSTILFAAQAVVSGANLGQAGRKFRNVAANGRVAFVVDDVTSVQPWRVRCLEIRGRAGAVDGPGGTTADVDGSIIRVHPQRIISFGIEEDQEPHLLTPRNRNVAEPG